MNAKNVNKGRKFSRADDADNPGGEGESARKFRRENAKNSAPLVLYTKSHAIPENKGLQNLDSDGLLYVCKRVERFALQNLAAEILDEKVVRGEKWAYKHRVNYCLRAPIFKDDEVGLFYNVGREKAHFGNLQRCANVWNCPVCAAAISEGRRKELQRGIASWRARGGAVYLITFTNRHNAGDDLAQLLANQKKAFVKFWQKRAVVTLLKSLGYVGRIVSTEVTHGKNGWHPHYHMLVFFSGVVNSVALQNFLATHWVDVCKKVGMCAPTLEHGVDVKGGDKAAAYASKWGLESEVTKGHIKKGKEDGKTPFDLLRAAAHCERAAVLFREFADVFKGRRQLVWSDGLKELLSVESVSDEQLVAETDENSVRVTGLSQSVWYIVLARQGRARILELCERDYKDGGDRLRRMLEYICSNFIEPSLE